MTLTDKLKMQRGKNPLKCHDKRYINCHNASDKAKHMHTNNQMTI